MFCHEVSGMNCQTLISSLSWRTLWLHCSADSIAIKPHHRAKFVNWRSLSLHAYSFLIVRASIRHKNAVKAHSRGLSALQLAIVSGYSAEDCAASAGATLPDSKGERSAREFWAAQKQASTGLFMNVLASCNHFPSFHLNVANANYILHNIKWAGSPPVACMQCTTGHNPLNLLLQYFHPTRDFPYICTRLYFGDHALSYKMYLVNRPMLPVCPKV